MRRSPVTSTVVGFGLLALLGACASHSGKAPATASTSTRVVLQPRAVEGPVPPAGTSPPAVIPTLSQPDASATPELHTVATKAEAKAARASARRLCSQEQPPGAPLIDETRRVMYETLCGAALWFDGLFGEQNNIASAKRTSGRLEISGLSSTYEGFKLRTRGNVRIDFPNLNNRLNAFFGRDDEDDFVRDRNEGLALRSQFIPLETDERWLAGLGYSLPGSYKQRTDFRVGGKGGRTPEIFAQARHRRNWVIDEQNLWHFRETAFWTNRDGFGSTTSLDYDHVLSHKLLLRWGNIGTVSESTDGLDWRSAALLYQNLPQGRAIAYEVFVRGETSNEVPLKEWGTRAVYRQLLMHREWLAGEFVLGYSWPRFELVDAREGSVTVGLGVEILIGNWK
ncbi:MAG: hypothetical protein ABI639_13460 [Thermoanaerobaculia bacterium]